MKGRYSNKHERRVVFRGWRRHVGSNKKVHFEESRKKVILDVISKES